MLRIEAYASFFSNSSIRTLFFVHHEFEQNMAEFKKIEIVSVGKKSNLSKALGAGKYLDVLTRRPLWFYSYGIPLSRRVGENNWLHISNILPLYLDHIPTSYYLFLKMYLYKIHLRYRSNYCDIVSAESKFSLDLYSKHVCQNTPQVLLKNGIPEKLIVNNESNKFGYNYAVTVGTYNYKRLDVAYKVFELIKKEFKLIKLIIIGNVNNVHKEIRCKEDVLLIDYLSDNDYYATLAGAEIFLSTSSIENSSNAVIEGLCLSKKLLLVTYHHIVRYCPL